MQIIKYIAVAALLVTTSYAAANGQSEDGLAWKKGHYGACDKKNKDNNGRSKKCVQYESKRAMGDGHIQSYVTIGRDDVPISIGVEFTDAALKGLPMAHGGDGNSCFDTNGDGLYQPAEGECLSHYEYVLDLPPAIKSKTSFEWILINWNPQGHAPEGVFSNPHFDFHFYTQSYRGRNMIGTGNCPGLTSCAAFEKAVKDVPPEFMPMDYINVAGVEARMGNHLVDQYAKELHEGEFTHTFLYGSYDGAITFWEPMITKEYLEQVTDECSPIKLPSEVAEPGYYPTKYCVKHDPKRKVYRVSLTGFEPWF